jgi:hypothetical protein
MKKAEEKRLPTDYFTREEFQRIEDATFAYGDWRGGRDFRYRPERMRALIQLMRWSGLAIRNAVSRWSPLWPVLPNHMEPGHGSWLVGRSTPRQSRWSPLWPVLKLLAVPTHPAATRPLPPPSAMS